MAIFDDPKKELKRLHEQLLAEQEDALEEMVEEYGEEDYRDFFQEDYREEEEQDIIYRNFSNRYGADVRNFSNGYRGEDLSREEDDEMLEWEDGEEEPYALTFETKRERRRRLRKEKREKKKKQEKQSAQTNFNNLKIILLLETLGILGILIWWVVAAW